MTKKGKKNKAGQAGKLTLANETIKKLTLTPDELRNGAGAGVVPADRCSVFRFSCTWPSD
jgi:hypothetical protein